MTTDHQNRHQRRASAKIGPQRAIQLPRADLLHIAAEIIDAELIRRGGRA